MGVVQSVPDDEIAAELAGSWSADPGVDTAFRPVVVGAGTPRRQRSGPGELYAAGEAARPGVLAHERTLPVSPALAGLIPAGLPRAATVEVSAAEGSTGATTLALSLVSAASRAGSWVAVVGLPALGLAAAAEAGVALDRLVVIEPPPAEHWATVVGALVGAFDIVLVGAPALRRRRQGEVRRLIARSRERPSVIVSLAGPAAGGSSGSSGSSRSSSGDGFGADLRLAVRTVGWDGLGAGHGTLRRRRAVVVATGRRAAARARRAELWLPDDEGRVRPVDAAADAVDADAAGGEDPVVRTG